AGGLDLLLTGTAGSSGTAPAAAPAAPAEPLRHRPLGVGQERQLPGGLDGHRHLPLVSVAVARRPAGLDLRPLREEAAEEVGVLVVDPGNRVPAEDADLGLAPAGAERSGGRRPLRASGAIVVAGHQTSLVSERPASVAAPGARTVRPRATAAS